MCMRGHAAANILPVIAANRVGREVATNDPELAMSFYGSSFISNHKGKLLAEAARDSTGVLVQCLDLAAMREERLTWGIYRDRRPEMYGPLLGLDGRQSHVRWTARGALDV
jgi:N-carbamoylputrescine amidase